MNKTSSSVETWSAFLTQEAMAAHARDVYQRYEKTTFYIDPTADDKRLAPFGKLPIPHDDIPDGICAWTSGMALLAGRLKEKKSLDQLMVAHTIEALVTSLKEKCVQDEPIRCAWVVCPAQSWCPLPTNFPLHKMCVALETNKEADKKIIKVAILDSYPIGRQGYITPERLTEPLPDDIWEGYGDNNIFNAAELLCRAFFKAINGLNSTSQVFHSPVMRQKEAGCEIFALKDAQMFLQNKEFFNQIKTQNESKFPIKNATLHQITHLPVEHMKGTHSSEVWDKYFTDLDAMQTTPYIEEKVFKVGSSKKYLIMNLAGEMKNEFTTVKALKYSSWAIKMMEQQPDKARALISSTFIQ